MRQRAGPLSKVVSALYPVHVLLVRQITQHISNGVRWMCLGTRCPSTYSVVKQRHGFRVHVSDLHSIPLLYMIQAELTALQAPSEK